MARREQIGVSWYSRGTVQAQAAFPEGDVCCKWCRFCVRDPYAPSLRHRCILTDYIIYSVEQQADTCPLTIIDEHKEADSHD